MSCPSAQLGSRAFNHPQPSFAEAECDRLRHLAQTERGKRQSCFDRAHQAYERGDGALAHELSEEGKRHGQLMDRYNKQASDFIFRENNAVGRVDADTVDLHGQYVEEAENILEQRIRYAQQTGQTHLQVIVGKGIHSRAHVQKLKPRVEQICQELGLQYETEENAGRIYISLTGGPAQMPPQHHGQHGGGGYQQPYGQQQEYGGAYPGQQQAQFDSSYPGQQQHQGAQHQQNTNMQIEEGVKKALPGILRAFKSCCCVVM